MLITTLLISIKCSFTNEPLSIILHFKPEYRLVFKNKKLQFDIVKPNSRTPVSKDKCIEKCKYNNNRYNNFENYNIKRDNNFDNYIAKRKDDNDRYNYLDDNRCSEDEKAIGIAEIIPEDKYYIIKMANKYMIVIDAPMLTQNYNLATMFEIIPQKEGYLIARKGRCMTKLGRDVVFEKCYTDYRKNRQVFDFIFFNRNMYDIECGIGLESDDYEESTELDLQKKFEQSVYDNMFIDSFKYFYDNAVCEELEKGIDKENENNCQNNICKEQID